LLVPVPVDMSRNVLGISWVNGRFHASAIKGRTALRLWSCPTPVHEDSEFASALAEAVAQTGFMGSKVMLALEHRRLFFYLQDTPPAADKVVDQLLQRAVERNNFFEERTVWSRLSVPPAKSRPRFLLTLMPEALVCSLAEICDAQGLELLGVFPLPAMADDTLRSLSVPQDEAVLVAADLGDALHLLLGKGDGTVLFCRTVTNVDASKPSASIERASQEINRTLLFAQQQFGCNVTQLFVSGTDAFNVLKEQPIRPGLAMHPSPVPEDALCYVRRVAVLSPRLGSNLLGALPCNTKRRQQVAALGMAALFCASIFLTVLVEVTVRARERAVTIRARQLQEEINSESLQRQAARWRALLQLVHATNQPPVPELFASYLPAAVPDSIRLTAVDLSRTTSAWNCRIEGVAREGAGDFAALIEAFEHELQTNVFKLHITDSTHRRLVRGTETPPPGIQHQERMFFVTGEIK
jgi:hypothetical protein